MKGMDYVCNIFIWIQVTFQTVVIQIQHLRLRADRNGGYFMKNSKRYLITMTAMLSVLLLFASCGGKDVDTDTEKNGETEDVSAEFSDTDSPDTDINPDEIILPKEDDFSNPDFVIKKGVLVKYFGSDTIVTVPDTVGEIGEYAFSHSSSPESIVEIRLGKNVGKISPKAFFELDALIKVETGENPYFEEYHYDNEDIYPLDGEYFPTVYAISSFCQPIIFCFGYELDGILDFLTETDYYIEKENITIAMTDALLNITINEGDIGYYCVLNAITYGNYIKEFDGFSLDGVYRFRAFEAKEAFVFTRATYNFSEAYIFAGGETFEMSGDEDYTVRFFKEGDRLKYCKMPRKYSSFSNGHGVANFFLIYNEIMSRNEFCSEYGSVEISENGFVYTSERMYGLSEHLRLLGQDIDECFEKYYCEGEYSTLDELIEANVKRLAEENNN